MKKILILLITLLIAPIMVFGAPPNSNIPNASTTNITTNTITGNNAAGVQFRNYLGQAVALFGAGSSQGVTFSDGVTFTSLTDGCLYTSSNLLTSTGVACNSATSGFGWASTTVPNSNSIYSTALSNVGIGTTTPTQKLTVSGNLYLNAVTPKIYAQGGSGQERQIISYDSPNELINFGANGTTSYMTLRSNGNLGIGTTTPYAQLSVTNVSTNPSFVVEDSTSPDSTPFVIDASGNVGVSTSSPYAPLSVNGKIAGSLLSIDSSVGTSYVNSILQINNSLKVGNATPLALDGFGTKLYEFQIDGNVNDVVGGNIWNTSTGPLALAGLFFDNANTTIGGIGLASKYYAGSVFAGPNFNGMSVGLGALGPNEYAVYNTDGAVILASATSTGEIRAYTGVNTYAGGAPDLTINRSGNVSISTSTTMARLDVNGENNGTVPLLDISSVSSFATTSRFLIDSTGQVGIGTTSPQAILNTQVTGNAFGLLLTQNSGATLNRKKIGFGTDTESKQWQMGTDINQNNGDNFWLFSRGLNSFAQTWLNNGNVGFGTTTPAERIVATGNLYLATADAKFYVNGGSAQPRQIIGYTSSTENLVFGSNGTTNYATLRSNGNFGVSTTTPYAKLSVTNTGTDPSFIVEDSTSPDTSPFIIDSAGLIGVSTTSPAYNLSVVGDTLITGNLLKRQGGTAPTVGNATLVAGTVTVSTTAAKANSYIMLTRKTSGGTIGTAITYTVSAGTSFTINSDNPLDTSTFSWFIVDGY